MVSSLPCTSMARPRAPKTLQSPEAEQLHAILFAMHRRESWDSSIGQAESQVSLPSH